MQAGSPTVASRQLSATTAAAAFGGFILLGCAVAWGAPFVDHALNLTSTAPGLVSFLGVGLTVLALTAILFIYGLRGLLPRTAVFVVAAFGYNALLVAVKLGMGPIAIYAQNEYYRAHSLPPGAMGEDPGFRFLTSPFAYPFLAAIMALVYAGAFALIYLIFNSRLRDRLGMQARVGTRFLQLFVVMFFVAVAGGVTIIGLLGFLEYAFNVVFATTVGLLIAVALVAAITVCSIAFREASEQAALTRNVTLLSTFAWIGLAFIAAYHIIWVVFLLSLISLWPLKPWAYVSGAK